MRSLQICLVTLILFFSLAQQIIAASISISNSRTQINGFEDELPVNVTLSINKENGTEYYLRGVFFKNGTTQNCGKTWNGNEWFSGKDKIREEWKNFLKVSINESSWSGQLMAKLDADDPDCKESGTYNFKIQRFTTTSSDGTYDDQNEQILSVVLPTPTPSLAPTPTPTKVVLPTPTKVATPTPTSVKLPTPTVEKTTPTPTPSPEITKEVLAATASEKKNPMPSQEAKVLGEKTNSFPQIFIYGGIIIICISCGILGFQFWKERYKKE